MSTVKSTADLNQHVRQDENEANMHFPKGFLAAGEGDIIWKDETGNVSWIRNPVLPAVLDFVDSTAAPPTEADGDIYLLDATGAILDVDTIVWQSGTTVRYTFNGAPDLSGVAVNDFLTGKLAANSSNNGTFKITAVNDGSDYVDVTNVLRIDGTDDEASDTPATGQVTDELWDGATPNSWVKFVGATGLWSFIEPFTGLLVDDLTAGAQRRFDGTIWNSISTLTGGGTLNKITRWTGAASLGDSIMTEAATVVTAAGGYGVTSASNNKALDDASSTALLEIDGFSQNEWVFSSDDGALLKGYAYIGDDFVKLFGGTTTKLGVYGQGLLILSSSQLDESVGGFGSHIKVGDNSAIDLGSSSLDKAAIWIGTRSGVMKAGVVNSVIAAGTGITGKTSNTLYAPQIGFFESGTIEGLFRSATLTADRTWDLPDKSGVIALEGAIQPGWSDFLAPAQITADQNNYNPSGWGVSKNRLELTTDADRSITGLVSTGFDRTHSVLVINENASSKITLKAEDGASTAANRFKIQGDLQIEPGESVMLLYSVTATRWIAVTTIP